MDTRDVAVGLGKIESALCMIAWALIWLDLIIIAIVVFK